MEKVASKIYAIPSDEREGLAGLLGDPQVRDSGMVNAERSSEEECLLKGMDSQKGLPSRQVHRQACR